MGNFLKTWFTVLRGREKLRNECLLVAFVFGAESVVLPPQSTIRNLQLLISLFMSFRGPSCPLVDNFFP